MKSKVILTQGECLAEMARIPDSYVDMVMCDLPYGTTQNKWDSIIDLERLWAAYKRICKPTAAIVLTAAQPFTSVLVCSNLKDFKYQWVWEKTHPSGHLNAKRRPMGAHEDVLVFGGAKLYKPQMTTGHPRVMVRRNIDGNRSTNYGAEKAPERYDSTERYPRSVVVFAKDKQHSSLHPTQKPLALMEYMVQTYTNPGMTILDNCMGSGTTGVACVNLGRSFIGIEQDATYFKIAQQRITEARK